MASDRPSNNSKMKNGKLKPWEIISRREVFVAKPWITVEAQQVKLPDGRVISDYHWIDLKDYVMVFAQMADGKVIVERQYKHGVGRVTLTLPAGAIEDGEPPLEAAKRELLEETGYTSDDWQSLGTYVPHGSYGCGRAHPFLARNARWEATPNSGDLEDMEIVTMEVKELWDAVRSGDMCLVGSVATIALATNSLTSQG